MMDLKQARNVRPGELVAFVGAGSKTTIMWRLLRQLVVSGERAVFTTTTFTFEPKGTPLLLSSDPDPAHVARLLIESTFLVLASARERTSASVSRTPSSQLNHPIKLAGVEPQILDDLARRMPGVTWLVETDAVKRHKLVAMTERQLLVPRGSDQVVIAAELEVLGQSLGDIVVHRPEHAAQLLQVAQGTPVTPAILTSLLNYAAWRLRTAQIRGRMVALLTQQDAPLHPQAEMIADQLLERDLFQRVVLVSLSAANPVLRVW
jgi:probable selenium-dependent hydroxylase accessory protein YqeC